MGDPRVFPTDLRPACRRSARAPGSARPPSPVSPPKRPRRLPRTGGFAAARSEPGFLLGRYGLELHEARELCDGLFIEAESVRDLCATPNGLADDLGHPLFQRQLGGERLALSRRRPIARAPALHARRPGPSHLLGQCRVGPPAVLPRFGRRRNRVSLRQRGTALGPPWRRFATRKDPVGQRPAPIDQLEPHALPG